MKVLIAASECSPFVKIGGIADVIGSLPSNLRSLGIDVKVTIPYYKSLLEDAKFSINVIKYSENYVRFDNKNLKYEVYLTNYNGIEIFLIKNIEYISNGGIYYDQAMDAVPNAESVRFSLFSKIIANHFVLYDKFKPEIIHCNDWHTASVVQYLEALQRSIPGFKKPKTILTIHNLAYQGFTSADTARKLGLNKSYDRTIYWDLLDDNLDLLLQGIVGADCITTVSKTYAREIQTPEFGEGLNDILSARQGNLYGILNGIDYNIFNPETDPFIYRKYNESTIREAKNINKEAILESLNLKTQSSRPLISLISRLVDQKGLDILIPVIKDIIKTGAVLVILGTGDKSIENKLENLNSELQGLGQFKAIIEFSNKIAMNLYAGSDFLLVPSRFEPCGLTQMIAMRYGTVPIVRKTGGLSDTVEDGKTGFVFESYSSNELLYKIKAALEIYNADKLEPILRNALKANNSWHKSSLEYLDLYTRLLQV